MQEETIALEQDNTALPKIDIELDWEQYFRDFCDAHGKYSVVYESDYLLFPDGWRYNAFDYAGPEYPPPEKPEELNALLWFYWKRRLKIITSEAKDIERLLTDLERLARSKDRSLSQKVTYKNDDGQSVTRAQPINYKLINQRLDWLKQDMVKCQDELAKISSAQ